MSYRELFTTHFSTAYYQATGIFSIYIITTLLALTMEYAVVGKYRSTLYRIFYGKLSASLKQDLVVWVLEITNIWSFVGKLLTFGITFYLANMVNAWISSISIFKFVPHIPSLPLQIILFLLFADFAGYWLHRTFHKRPALWLLHKFHHTATEMTVFTATRDNPVVSPLFLLFTGLPVALFGSPSAVPLWVTFFGLWHALIVHSQIPSNWGWIGKWIIVSPQGHSIHHSKSRPHHDKNFAFMFPLWDHLFGTYYNGHEPVAAIGVDEQTFANSLYKQIFRDIVGSIKLVYKSSYQKGR